MANEEYPDTSYAQGATDPTALATRKPPVWCIRAGYGTGTVDDQYRRNVEIARELGIPVIHYWFCYPQVQGPESQAAAFNAVVGDLPPGDGLMADFEDDREWTWTTIAGAGGPIDWAKRFLTASGPNDYPPLWYTYPAMLTSYGLGLLRGRWPFVLGDGGAGYQLGQQIWQYTTRGSWPGFSGAVDINRVVVGNLSDYLYRGNEPVEMEDIDMDRLVISAYPNPNPNAQVLVNLDKGWKMGIPEGDDMNALEGLTGIRAIPACELSKAFIDALPNVGTVTV